MALVEEGLTEVFRSRDPIERLKICVTLQEVTAGPSVDVDVDGDGVGDGDPSTALIATVAETVTIGWQEKLFSAPEIERYRDLDRCVTEEEKEYHQLVVKQLARNPRGSRLYTYVDEDDYSTLHEVRLPPTVDGVCSTSVLAEKMTSVRKRKGYHAVPAHVGPHPHTNDVVIAKPTHRDQAKRLVDTPFQVMYIVADLSPPRTAADATATTDSEQHVLCTVRVDENGVITMSPTFNGPRPRYRINHKGTVWEYELSHASVPITEKEAAAEAAVLQEMYQRHADLCANKVGRQFHSLPDTLAHDTVYHLFGEIVSAQAFEYDNLYVRLQVDLPSGWVLDTASAKAFVTQISQTSSTGDLEDTAHFSYPFEAAIRRDGQLEHEILDPDEVQPSISPKLLLQVNSLDLFERHRPEGYGYLPIPLHPGLHDEVVETWRPVGDHVVGKMRRFFLGGAPELQDATYAAIPHDHHDIVMSKQGFRTEAAGSVRVRVNVVKQRHPDTAAADERLQQKKLHKPQHAKLSTISHSTLDIVAAFKRAHSKMQQSQV
eukprot:m.107333 g.107333  ORF g.107333 m.107333 type:complete len:545 (+) comp12746_c0_seq1:3993-5627(+)